jgi:hypothetical protein
MRAAGAEGRTMRRDRPPAPEWPEFACGLGCSGSSHPRSVAGHAFPLTGDRLRSRVSGADQRPSGGYRFGRRGGRWPASRRWRCWPRDKCVPCPPTTCRPSGPLYTKSSALPPDRTGMGRNSPACGQCNRFVGKRRRCRSRPGYPRLHVSEDDNRAGN